MWLLASNGPGDNFKYAEQIIMDKYDNKKNINELDLKFNHMTRKLVYWYAGKVLEPILNPLGYDWKIGIAIITSLQQESIRWNLTTIFSVGSENVDTIKEKMSYKENQMELLFNLPTGVSLMVFYAFALQCMSTIAIVKKKLILEVAGNTIYIYDKYCLYFCTNCISDLS